MRNGEEVERILQVHECSGVAGELNLSSGQRVPGFGVPQFGGDGGAGPVACEPEPAPLFVGADVQSANHFECSGERRNGRCVSLREPHREPVEHDVNRPRWFGTRGRGARGFGGLQHAAGILVAARQQRGPERLQVGLARQFGIERLEASGRVEEQPSGVAAFVVKGDLSAQVLHSGDPQGVRRAGLDRDEQAQRRVGRAGVALRHGGGEQPLGTASGLRRQHRRALEECRRRGQAPAALRAPGRALELGGDVLVGPGRGMGSVPGATIGIDFRIGGLRQGAVKLLSLLERSRPVGRRAYERMTEPHPRAELEQAGLDRRRCRLNSDSELLGCSPHQQRVADGIGRRESQQAPGLGGKRVEPAPEALLDSPRQRQRVGESEAASQLRRRQPPRQFQQRQRVAARFGDDLVADTRVKRPGKNRVQELARVCVAQPFDQQLRQPRQLLARSTRREDQADRFRLQPPCNEREHLR